MGPALHFFVYFGNIVYSAVVIRQPYNLILGVTTIIRGCRAVTLWQPLTHPINKFVDVVYCINLSYNAANQ